MPKKKKLRGLVKKIIKPVSPIEPEKAEIDIIGADDLYREIRIENVVTDEDGKKDKLRPGEGVDVIVATEDDSKSKAS